MSAPNPFAGKAGATTKAPKAPVAKGNGKAAADDADDDTPDTSLSAPAPNFANPFAVPTGLCDYTMDDLTGELLLFRPSERDEMFTSASKPGEGPSPFVRSEVWRVENDFEYIEEMLIFQEAPVRNLSKTLRGPNALSLIRLSRGKAAGGKSAPYLFDRPTQEETDAVLAWCTENGISLT